MKILISFAAILLTLQVVSQNTFIREFSREGTKVAVQTVIQTSDGGYALAASIAKGEPGIRDLWLIRTDGDGDTLWTRTFKNAIYSYIGDRILVQTPDEGYTVLTTRSMTTGLLHVSSTGDSLWEKAILPGRGISLSRASGDRYLAAIGNRYIEYVVLMDFTGTIIWQWHDHSVDTVNLNSATGWSVRESPEGGCILAGVNTNGFFTNNPLLVRLGLGGDSLWQRNYSNSWLWDGSFFSVDTASGGVYYAAGNKANSGNVDGLVMKFNTAGDTIWSRVIQGPKSLAFYSVRTNPDGSVVACGVYKDTIDHVWLMKFDAAGNIVWDRKYPGQYDSYGSCVDRAADGGYILCGTTCQSDLTPCKGVFIKTASDGTLSGLSSITASFNVSFMPNPADESLSLIFSPGLIERGSFFFLYDILGHGVRTLLLQPDQTKYTLPVGDLPEGIYLGLILSMDRTVASQKLVIRRNP